MTSIALVQSVFTIFFFILGILMEGGESPLGSYLWLPYVLLTLVILLMLIASFINFHLKYKDRYVRRSELARGGSVSKVERKGYLA